MLTSCKPSNKHTHTHIPQPNDTYVFAYDAGNPNLTLLYVHTGRCTKGCRDELWICVLSSLWEMCVIPACQEIEWVDGILIRAGAKIERQIYGFYIRP